MALWDIKGKVAGLPVWALLGGRAREYVELYAHVQAPTIEGTVERAQQAVESGFRAIRFGLDHPGTDDGFDAGKAIRHTVRAAKQLRESLGEEIDISVDVHQRLSPVRAVEFCNAVANYNLLFVEDPIRPEDPTAYRQLRSRVRTPLATGENLYSKWQFRPLIEEELTDYLRIDLCLAGGLTEARKIAALGETHYLDVVPHCARGPFLEQVSLHFSCATANVALQEHTGGPEWWNTVFPGLADFDKGIATPPKGPGLGVSFDEQEAREHPFVQRQMPRWLKPDGSVQDW
jgi:galactonate dehydratase